MEELFLFICPEERAFYMSDFNLSRLIISLSIEIIILLLIFAKKCFKKPIFSVKFITRTSLFAALATILYVVPFLQFKIPFFPAFLEIHFDEVPAFIAGFAYGPISAIFVLIIKTIIKLPFSSSLGVGELADLIYGIVLIIPAAIFYRKKRNFKSAIIGMGIGAISQVIVSSFFTTFFLLDFYMAVMGLSKEAILAMCQAVNPNITSLGWIFYLYVGLPFNAFKDVVILLLTILLYKRSKFLIDRI